MALAIYHFHSSSVSGIAFSSSEITDSSHKSNVIEGEKKPTFVPTILDIGIRPWKCRTWHINEMHVTFCGIAMIFVS